MVQLGLTTYTKQVTELIDDLAEEFFESHETENERSAVEKYGHMIRW